MGQGRGSLYPDLDAQETAIRGECERRGWALREVVRDEGVSAKSLDRPGLREAMERIADGEAVGLIASKLDRLSRSVVDFGVLLDWFEGAGATLVALDLGLDTSTPGGRLVANVFASVAEWERDTIAARTREGLAAARAQGRTISRHAVADNPKLRDRIVRMRERGMTLQAIADRLNAEGVPTLPAVRSGGTPASRLPPATSAASHAGSRSSSRPSRGGAHSTRSGSASSAS